MTEAEAIDLARHEADARRWPWIEPINVRCKPRFLLGKRRWCVRSNEAKIGLHVIVDMDESGRVLRPYVRRT